MGSGCFVLDSYALIAFLTGEPGEKEIGRLLAEASNGQCEMFMSIVNLGEVLYMTEREAGIPGVQDVLGRLNELPIHIIDADRVQTFAAAHIKAHWAIAYADCFAAALASTKNGIVLTGDPEFRLLEEASIVSVNWIVPK